MMKHRGSLDKNASPPALPSLKKSQPVSQYAKQHKDKGLKSSKELPSIANEGLAKVPSGGSDEGSPRISKDNKLVVKADIEVVTCPVTGLSFPIDSSSPHPHLPSASSPSPRKSSPTSSSSSPSSSSSSSSSIKSPRPPKSTSPTSFSTPSQPLPPFDHKRAISPSPSSASPSSSALSSSSSALTASIIANLSAASVSQSPNKGSKKNAHEDDDSSSTSSSLEGGSSSLTKMLASEDYDSDDGDESLYDIMDSVALRREIKILKRINSFTRDIAENSNQAIIVVEAASKKIYWVNSRAQTMFGKLADDMIDANVNILIPPEIARKHDKIMDGFLTMWAKERAPPASKVVNPREPREIKAVRYNSDGSTTLFDAEIFVRFMKVNGREDKPPKFFMAYLNDVTELKHMKHQLSVSKVIQQKSAEAIVVCDLHGKIITCNSMTEQMFGTSLSFLLTHNKNIKWFMPRNIAEKHDSYLSVWRDNFRAGYDLGKSTIIAKVRNMKGRRPGEKEDELFSIVLRVELVENELVAYIRDVSDTITKDEFNSALVGKVFPKCIKNQVLRAQVDAYEICEHLNHKTIVYTDLSEFTKYSNGAEVADVYKYLNTMYKAFDVIVPQYAGEVVKRTGDGIIAMFGLVGNVKRHADRAVYCALAMLHWAHENNYRMRVGVASGDVGSGIFGDGESRPQWDVLGETVNVASRMQAYGVVGKMQLTEITYQSLTDSRLRNLFETRVLQDMKGYGTYNTYLSKDSDFIDFLPVLHRRLVEIESERKRILEREKRLEELQLMGSKRAQVQGGDDEI